MRRMRPSGTHGRARLLSAIAALTLIISACGSSPSSTARLSGGSIAPESSGAAAAPAASAGPATPPGSAAPGPSIGTQSSTAPGSSVAAGASPQPSRQDLIATALAGGRIDHVTSLLYRGYAHFGMPELPGEFASAPSLGDDAALFDEIVDALPTLSAADQQRLRPFIVRPTEPDSIFASKTAGAARLAVAPGKGSAPAARLTVAAPLTVAATECRDWTDSGNASQHFKVWACTGGDPGSAAADVAVVAGLLEEIWTPMTRMPPGGMGPPIPDGSGPNVSREFGGDGRIDVYELRAGDGLFRGGALAVPEGSIAAAVPSPPYIDAAGNVLKTSSGFILVNRARIAERDQMRRDLIHEFFHVLQKAHNRTGPVRGSENHWFGEASATWAETYYFRAGSAFVHTWFASVFQLSHLGLESTTGDHPYAAYIWPFFMEQEAGAAAVFNAWVGIEAASPGDFRAVSDAIDAQAPFATRFRDFAVRNLNRSLDPTEPHQKRYVELDGNFPDGVSPVPIESGEIAKSGTYPSGPVSIEPLAASYFYLVPDVDARDVTINLSGLAPVQALDGDVLLHIAGRWERRPIKGTMLQLCRDDPADNFDQMHLVLSNHGREPRDRITGEFSVRSRIGCGDLVGTINWTTTTQVTGSRGGSNNSSDEVSVGVRFTRDGDSWVNDGSSFSWGGRSAITPGPSRPGDYPCSQFSKTSTTVGGGDFSGDVERIEVAVDREKRMVYVTAVVTGELFTHEWHDVEEGPGEPHCVRYDSDSTQGGPSDPGDWAQNPTCGQGGESVDGKISDDGKTVDFTCSSSDTKQVNAGNDTVTNTSTVTGHLTFVRGAP